MSSNSFQLVYMFPPSEIYFNEKIRISSKPSYNKVGRLCASHCLGCTKMATGWPSNRLPKRIVVSSSDVASMWRFLCQLSTYLRLQVERSSFKCLSCSSIGKLELEEGERVCPVDWTDEYDTILDVLWNICYLVKQSDLLLHDSIKIK